MPTWQLVDKIRKWDGANWIDANVKYWDGAAWSSPLFEELEQLTMISTVNTKIYSAIYPAGMYGIRPVSGAIKLGVGNPWIWAEGGGVPGSLGLWYGAEDTGYYGRWPKYGVGFATEAEAWDYVKFSGANVTLAAPGRIFTQIRDPVYPYDNQGTIVVAIYRIGVKVYK